MRGLVVSLFLLFALVAGSLHAPVAAHEASFSDYGVIDVHETVFDHDHDAPPSSDDDGSAAHHHHCPTAVADGKIVIADSRLADRQMKFPGLVHALASLSQAPPTEPPAA